MAQDADKNAQARQDALMDRELEVFITGISVTPDKALLESGVFSMGQSFVIPMNLSSYPSQHQNSATVRNFGGNDHFG